MLSWIKIWHSINWKANQANAQGIWSIEQPLLQKKEVKTPAPKNHTASERVVTLEDHRSDKTMQVSTWDGKGVQGSQLFLVSKTLFLTTYLYAYIYACCRITQNLNIEWIRKTTCIIVLYTCMLKRNLWGSNVVKSPNQHGQSKAVHHCNESLIFLTKKTLAQSQSCLWAKNLERMDHQAIVGPMDAVEVRLRMMY